MFRIGFLSIIRSLVLYDIYLLLCIQTPADGQRTCPKHVEFYSKNKFKVGASRWFYYKNVYLMLTSNFYCLRVTNLFSGREMEEKKVPFTGIHESNINLLQKGQSKRDMPDVAWGWRSA